MENEILIEFERTKKDTEYIVFRKSWLKQVIPNIILVALLIYPTYMVSIIFGVAISLGIGQNENSDGYIFFTILMIIVILNYFLSPIYKSYRLHKKQINDIHNDGKISKIKYSFHENKFRYENNSFKYESHWSNLTSIKIQKDYIHFQSKVPNIYFWIPATKVKPDIEKFLLEKISSR